MADEQRSRPEMGIPRAADTLRADTDSTRIDLMALTPRELDIFAAGVIHGATVAHDLEHERDEAHAAALHARAYDVVHAMAKVPPRDAEKDAQRAARRDQWWAERRSA